MSTSLLSPSKDKSGIQLTNKVTGTFCDSSFRPIVPSCRKASRSSSSRITCANLETLLEDQEVHCSSDSSPVKRHSFGGWSFGRASISKEDSKNEQTKKAATRPELSFAVLSSFGNVLNQSEPSHDRNGSDVHLSSINISRVQRAGTSPFESDETQERPPCLNRSVSVCDLYGDPGKCVRAGKAKDGLFLRCSEGKVRGGSLSGSLSLAKEGLSEAKRGRGTDCTTSHLFESPQMDSSSDFGDTLLHSCESASGDLHSAHVSSSDARKADSNHEVALGYPPTFQSNLYSAFPSNIDPDALDRSSRGTANAIMSRMSQDALSPCLLARASKFAEPEPGLTADAQPIMHPRGQQSCTLLETSFHDQLRTCASPRVSNVSGAPDGSAKGSVCECCPRSPTLGPLYKVRMSGEGSSLGTVDIAAHSSNCSLPIMSSHPSFDNPSSAESTGAGYLSYHSLPLSPLEARGRRRGSCHWPRSPHEDFGRRKESNLKCAPNASSNSLLEYAEQAAQAAQELRYGD